ncbi:centrosomal protein of 112 kDa-like isoform X3 [Branchiostoma floridae x Branchiostoma japonicum]
MDSITLDSSDSKLDAEFDRSLADMKPYVLKLPHKTERQRCALWIKKLCEPVAPGPTARKNRNMYAELLLHMLKRGVLEGPFNHRPDPGPLKTLPSYMSIYFDDVPKSTVPKSKVTEQNQRVPDWVAGELDDTLASSLLSRVEDPGSLSTSRHHPHRYSSLRKSPQHSTGVESMLRDRGAHRREENGADSRASRTLYSSRTKPSFSLSSDESEEETRRPRSKSPLAPVRTSPIKPRTTMTRSSTSTGYGSSSLRGHEDSTLGRLQEKELEMRTKLLQSRFHEEMLVLQQKHDGAVQKILDRKNEEMEDVKQHYRGKQQELEEQVKKLEKKCQSLVKESQVIRENRDRQIAELKKMTEQTTASTQNEYEKRLHDMVADFEQEKFDMQKQHTKNIQELLDDTNNRLQKMEQEYQAQTASTGSVVKELEARVAQLTKDVESSVAERNRLSTEKLQLEHRCSEISGDLADWQAKFDALERNSERLKEDHEQELRTLRNKSEASVEYLRQENSLAAARAQDQIGDLEAHVSQLKQSLQESEHERQRQIRELEAVHQQDKMHKENLHEKKVRALHSELEQEKADALKKIRKLEEAIKDKDEQIQKMAEIQKFQTQQADLALEDFKRQVEKNSNQVYADMKSQMEKVEADLERSKILREKQQREFQRQLEEERQRNEHKMLELKVLLEQEKQQMLRTHQNEKDVLQHEHEKALESLEDRLRANMGEVSRQAEERKDRDLKTISEMEQQTRELREEVIQANALRKQQLVELGLLREEEKQKATRELEATVNKFKSELEQQKLQLQREHATEMEQSLEKTNSRLKQIEREYTQRLTKQSETISELQDTIQQIREDSGRQLTDADRRLQDSQTRQGEEVQTLKRQHSAALRGLQQDVDTHKGHARSLEKRLQQQEIDQQEKLTHLQQQYEDRMRGLMPASLRQELEDTIASLKAQVNSLQQRASILQEELDAKSRY